MALDPPQQEFSCSDFSVSPSFPSHESPSVLEDVLSKIFLFLPDSQYPSILFVSRIFGKVGLGRWLHIYAQSTSLQNQKRLFYFNRATRLSIVYSCIERAQAKKFVGFNSKLGVSAYSFISSGINVFARVRPAALGHTVGVMFTFTKWQKREKIEGWWVENTTQEEEIWRINIPYEENTKDNEIWFAVYVRDSSGQEVWDANEGWNYSTSLLTLPTRTYDSWHPAVLQHEKVWKDFFPEGAAQHNDDSDDDFVEEVWLNVNHVMCNV